MKELIKVTSQLWQSISNKRLKRMIKILSIMPDSFRDELRYKRTPTSIVAESAIKNPHL